MYHNETTCTVCHGRTSPAHATPRNDSPDVPPHHWRNVAYILGAIAAVMVGMLLLAYPQETVILGGVTVAYLLVMVGSFAVGLLPLYLAVRVIALAWRHGTRGRACGRGGTDTRG